MRSEVYVLSMSFTHIWFVLCRGIGYAITKNIVNELSHPTVVCTTRSSAEQLTGLIR